MARACIIPVAAPDALRWAWGQLQDADLLLRAPLVPEAIFIAWLPDRAAYRELLSQVAFWRARGAVCLIARTGNDVVDSHIVEKNNGRVTFQEAWSGHSTKYRFLVPPEQFAKWVTKFARP